MGFLMHINQHLCENTCTKSLASIRHDMASEGQANKGGEEGVTVGHLLAPYEMLPS